MSLVRPIAGLPDGVAALDVDVVADGEMERRTDLVAVEEPLGIRLVHGPADGRIERDLAVTMRTPGDDRSLALGFLHGEGLVRTIADVSGVEHVQPAGSEHDADNVIRVELEPSIDFDEDLLTRHVYTTSSCGICGKASIEAVRVQIPDYAGRDALSIDREVLEALPERLRQVQEAFARTGGLHASAAFDREGRIVTVAEDVGRHNALDKLVGSSLSNDALPLTGVGLLFSGRASFELIQKAAMAGCPFVASIGPPSSLAVELAAEQRMTLVGFLSEQRFNIYSLPHRVRSGA